MTKPRVIIADMETQFVSPLVVQFVQFYGDSIDIEVVTEPDYFSSLFSHPQQVEVLIVSELLFRLELMNHRIRKVFVMTEGGEQVRSGLDNRVNYLYKYTSARDVFSIISRECEVLLGKVASRASSQIVLVTSSYGGAGKTLCSLALAHCLSRGNGKTVLFIGANYLQTFQQHLTDSSGVMDIALYSKWLKPESVSFEDAEHLLRTEAFDYFPPFKAPLVALGMDYSVFLQLAISARNTGRYDFIILDTESTFDSYKVELLNEADRIILLTDQSLSSMDATNLFLSGIHSETRGKILIACNRFLATSQPAKQPEGYIVSEYLDNICSPDDMSLPDIATAMGIRRVASLLT